MRGWPSSGMPRAKVLPRLMSPAAATTSAGVTWLSVPIWSSLPQRPQLESALKASSTAALETLMFRLEDCPGMFPPLLCRTARPSLAAFCTGSTALPETTNWASMKRTDRSHKQAT